MCIADRVFQGADDFGCGFFAKIQKQLTFAIDASFAFAPVELLQQFFELEIQLDDFLVELVRLGFEFQDTMSLFLDQLVFERQFGCLLTDLRLQFRDQLMTSVKVVWKRL